MNFKVCRDCKINVSLNSEVCNLCKKANFFRYESENSSTTESFSKDSRKTTLISYLLVLSISLLSITVLFALVNFSSFVANDNTQKQKSTIDVLREYYPGTLKLKYACAKLDASEDFVSMDNSIPVTSKGKYIKALEKARLAYFLLKLEFPDNAKYVDYLSYADSLIENAKENGYHQAFWFETLYYSSCF